MSKLLQVCFSVVAEVEGEICQPPEDSPWAQITASDGHHTPMSDKLPNQLRQFKEAPSRDSLGSSFTGRIVHNAPPRRIIQEST
jgi:hypothetical protein